MKMQAFITAASLANVITLGVIFLVPGGKCCWFDQFECELTKNCLNRDQVRTVFKQLDFVPQDSSYQMKDWVWCRYIV